ncbi:SEL1-like repeat protein [Deinococcus marmoris]|uniref:SEL1-like repeat protein n=1 Tax=Deinococcus marmoris TaxID=249408 RepID=UPI0012DDB2E3|nr:SEL1-like repeat protein [Deinococcus marmoris]
MGSGIAYKKIGDLYSDGKYIKADLEKALLNYDKSVYNGYTVALSDIAVIYTLIKDYGNIIHSWEKYFEYLDKHSNHDADLPTKAIFYILLKIRNNEGFNFYMCFLVNPSEIFLQIDEDIKYLIRSINKDVQCIKFSDERNNSRETEEIQLELVEKIADVKDLKECHSVFTRLIDSL